MNTNLTNGQITAFVFWYFGMAIDIVSTGYHTIVLNINREANPLFNWITPAPLMVLSIALVSICVFIALWFWIPIFTSKTNNKYDMYIISILYSLGVWRIFGGYTWLVF